MHVNGLKTLLTQSRFRVIQTCACLSELLTRYN